MDLNKPGSNIIRDNWDALSPKPFGRRLFSLFIRASIPYTGNIHPKIHTLRKGYACASMRDRHAIRNHLKSVHAVALANLAELTGNIALAYSLPDDARFIVKKMKIEYLKKSRGEITAVSECPPILSSEKADYVLPVELTDEGGDTVAKATLYTLVGPKK